MALLTSRQQLPLILLALAALFAFAAPAAAQQQEQEYCRDSLASLTQCWGFMHDPAAGASASCCAAYQAAFDADPFCLCYVADGTFTRATGIDVDVSRALQIPVSCGQVAPPIELCRMEGLVLPPYQPEGTPAVGTAAASAAPEASAPAMQPEGSVAPPTFTTPSPPPPTSAADPVMTASVMMTLMAVLVVAMA